MPQHATRRLAELLTQRWRDNTGAGKTPRTRWHVWGPTISLSGKQIAEALLSPTDLVEYNVKYALRAQRHPELSRLERLKGTARYKDLARMLSEPNGIDNLNRVYARIDIAIALIDATPHEIRLHNQLIGEHATLIDRRLRELCDGLVRRKHGPQIGYTLTRIDGETEDNRTNEELERHTLPPLETSWLVTFHSPNGKALTSRRE